MGRTYHGMQARVQHLNTTTEYRLPQFQRYQLRIRSREALRKLDRSFPLLLNQYSLGRSEQYEVNTPSLVLLRPDARERRTRHGP